MKKHKSPSNFSNEIHGFPVGSIDESPFSFQLLFFAQKWENQIMFDLVLLFLLIMLDKVVSVQSMDGLGSSV